MQHAIVGTWILRAFQMEDVETGARSEPFGAAPRGVLMLNPDGRMVALLTPRERTAPDSEAGQAAAFQKLVAYSGRYRLVPPDRFVTTVDVAWFESWVGTEQARTYTLDGDRLEIKTMPSLMPKPNGTEASVVGTLSWDRDPSAGG